MNWTETGRVLLIPESSLARDEDVLGQQVLGIVRDLLASAKGNLNFNILALVKQ